MNSFDVQYLQNEKGLEVTSIDISAKAIEACRLRGLQNAHVRDVMQMEGETFDTIILLMNGTGIFGQLKSVPRFLQKLSSLLAEDGQILIDSSDIVYMFDEEDDTDIRSNADYYGEVEFVISYKGEQEEPFDWLYLDFETLRKAANDNGLQCERVQEGQHFDYLAKMTRL